MWIPYGMSHYNTATGMARKRVLCEWCNTVYQYDLERKATGKGKSLLFLDNQGAKERAADRAQDKLEREIERAVDPIPCPQCGRYQTHMFKAAREEYHLGLYYCGIGFLILIFIFLGVGTKLGDGRHFETAPMWTQIVMAVSGALAVGSYFSRKVLISRMCPNDEPEEVRRAIASDRCVPVSNHEGEGDDDAWE
jgi:hypothetical protein